MTALHVMIVDDDRDLRESLQGLLEEDGHRVSWAANGDEALRRLVPSDLPDVIVLDLMMPIADGYEFRARQRNDPKLAHVPVIVMTAGGRGEGRFQELGVEAIVRKPFEFDDLVSLIRDAARRRTPPSSELGTSHGSPGRERAR